MNLYLAEQEIKQEYGDFLEYPDLDDLNSGDPDAYDGKNNYDYKVEADSSDETDTLWQPKRQKNNPKSKRNRLNCVAAEASESNANGKMK